MKNSGGKLIEISLAREKRKSAREKKEEEEILKNALKEDAKEFFRRYKKFVFFLTFIKKNKLEEFDYNLLLELILPWLGKFSPEDSAVLRIYAELDKKSEEEIAEEEFAIWAKLKKEMEKSPDQKNCWENPGKMFFYSFIKTAEGQPIKIPAINPMFYPQFRENSGISVIALRYLAIIFRMFRYQAETKQTNTRIVKGSHG